METGLQTGEPLTQVRPVLEAMARALGVAEVQASTLGTGHTLSVRQVLGPLCPGGGGRLRPCKVK